MRWLVCINNFINATINTIATNAARGRSSNASIELLDLVWFDFVFL